VTSTMLLIGRTPAALRRACIHAGKAHGDVGDRTGVTRAQVGVLDHDVDVGLVDGLHDGAKRGALSSPASFPLARPRIGRS
jgi:hypothetical protein